jgi:hypothetical protein
MARTEEKTISIRDALSYLEGLSVVALRLDGESVMVLVAGDDEPKASKTLKPHTGYLTASLGEHDRIELADVRKRLGFCGATYTPGPVAQRRDDLMAQAGYAPDREWRKGLKEPTLTIDQLEQIALQQPQPASATCSGCHQVAELHPDLLVCDACLVDRVNGAGELELDDPDDELYEHFKRCLKQRAVKPEPRKGEQLIPAGARHGQCRSCQADIIWISTANGRPMPLSTATIEERDGQRWALSHFSDCPHSKGWKR